MLARIAMSHALRSRTPADQEADEVVASFAQRVLAFFAWPFGLVLALRPQREREAARIAAEFDTRQWKSKAGDN
jgi:hypothetical protein